MSRRRIGISIAIGIATLLLVVPAAYHAAFHLPHRMAASDLRDELALRTERFRARFGGPDRYERPVLRGEPIEGNAGAALARAAGPLRSIELPSGTPAQLRRGAPPELRRLARAHAATLADVRRATRREWAFIDPYDEHASPVCENGIGNACLLLAALAYDAEPAECLRIAADYLRIAQDNRAGGCVGSCDPRAIAPRMMACAVRAERSSVEQASRELLSIVRSEPSDAVWHEAEVLRDTEEVLAQLDETPWLPRDGDEWARIREQGPRIAAAARALRHPQPGRRGLPPDCPAGYGMSVCEWLTVPRTLAAMMTVLAEMERGARFDAARPPVLGARWAIDPASGERLRWWTDAGQRTAWIYGLGLNGRDDARRGDDVGVRATLPRGPSLRPRLSPHTPREPGRRKIASGPS